MFIKLVIKNVQVELNKCNRSIAVFFTILFCSISTNLIAQYPYQFERINTENGLPANTIKGLQFDSKNRFLWVGTESGIVRYNGHSFQSFGDNADDFKLNGRINIFSSRVDNSLFGNFDDASVFSISKNKAKVLSSNIVIKTAFDYLNYKYQLKPKPYTDKRYDISISDFKINGDIYLPIERYLLKYKGDRFDTVLNLNVQEQVFTFNNRIFILQNNGVVKEVLLNKNEKNKEVVLHSFGLTPWMNSKHLDQIKIFQYKANDAAYLLKGTNIYNISFHDNAIYFDIITNQFPNDEYVRFLQIDQLTHTIYLGTGNRGLLVGKPRYFQRQLPSYTLFDENSSVYAQVLLPNGNIQSNAGQIFGLAKNYTPNIFKKSYFSSTFMPDQHTIYYSDALGLYAYDFRYNRQTIVSKNDLLFNGPFIQVDSLIYTITPKSIAKSNQNGTWDILIKFSKTPVNFLVFNIALIDKNNLLVATSEGLYKYNIPQNKFKLFYKDKTGANFRTIYNLNGYYLLGTYGAGVFMYKNDTIKQLPIDPNGYLKFAHCFVEDQHGGIWISTNKGIFMTTKLNLIRAWNEKEDQFAYRYYGKPDGIDVLELNGGCTPCALLLPNGNISFPGIDGLIQFNPTAIPNYEITPTIYLDKLKLNNKDVDTSVLNGLLSANTKLVEVELGVSGMLSEENIKIEYSIDRDNLWRNINIKNPILKFEKPNYGAHHFNIRWRNTFDENWSTRSFNLSLAYPWFIHPYMFFGYFALACFIVLLYIQYRTVVYQKRQKILEEEVLLKTITLKNMNMYLVKRNQAKDHAIAIMNHDILTPLKYLHITAKNVSSQATDKNIKKSIHQIATTSKELEYLTSNMLNWVKFDNIDKLPNKQSIDLFTLIQSLIEFVEPFTQNEEVLILNNLNEKTFIYNWSDSLRVLLYNLLMNAIKSTPKGQIAIDYIETSNGYSIIIQDTGIGMSESMMQYLKSGTSKDQVEELPKHKKGNGIGYQIIRHLIKLMDADIEIAGNLNAMGTKVSVHFQH